MTRKTTLCDTTRYCTLHALEDTVWYLCKLKNLRVKWYRTVNEIRRVSQGDRSTSLGNHRQGSNWITLRCTVKRLDEGFYCRSGLWGSRGPSTQSHPLPQGCQISFHSVHVVVDPASLLLLPKKQWNKGICTYEKKNTHFILLIEKQQKVLGFVFCFFKLYQLNTAIAWPNILCLVNSRKWYWNAPIRLS